MNSEVVNWKEDLINVLRYKLTKAVFSEYNIPLDKIVKFLEENEYKKVFEDSNGWQHDYWYVFQKDSEMFVLSGSLYYGKQIFQEADEQEKEEYLELISEEKWIIKR